MSRRRAGIELLRPATSVLGTVVGIVLVVAALPWLRGESPAETVLKIRFTARGRDDAAVDALRRELGLPSDVWSGVRDWLGQVMHGDLGTSWVSGVPVSERVGPALTTSLILTLTALAVAVALATTILARPVLQACTTGSPLPRRLGGLLAAAAAVPEVVIAVALVLALAVGLHRLPATGWGSPSQVVLPALALGVPAGGLLARLVATIVDQALAEPWARSWRVNGVGRGPVVRTVLRRVAAVGGPQVVVVMMTILGSAVAVEQVFAIPGAGRLALDAVLAQDLPVLQACLLGFVGIGVVAAGLAALCHRALMHPATSRTDGADLVTPEPESSRLTAVALLVLVAVVGAGLLRDGHSSHLSARLRPPSWTHPFGADAVGHDVLGRLGHGTALTVGLALLVSAAAFVIGVVAGLPARRVSLGGLDVLNTVPSTLVGIVVASAVGPGLLGACLATLAVAWVPLAVHTRTLVARVRAAGYVEAAALAGARPARITTTHVLPAVVVPVLRHALLRAPNVALGLAALSFIGLGADPDAAELGAMLADGVGYLERAPWLVLAPGSVLVLLGLVAGTAGGRCDR